MFQSNPDFERPKQTNKQKHQKWTSVFQIDFLHSIIFLQSFSKSYIIGNLKTTKEHKKSTVIPIVLEYLHQTKENKAYQDELLYFRGRKVAVLDNK